MTFNRRNIIKSLLCMTVFSLLPKKPATGLSHKTQPKVFIIGDSISIGYTPVVKVLLEGKAIVTRPKGNCNGTKLGVDKLVEWLDNEQYDLIHFNFGLHDMKHVDPDTGDGSMNPGDPVQSELPVYKKNLEYIVKELKATGAKLVFATTTPVPKEPNLVLREQESLEKYNRVALKVMRKHNITVNDLFKFVTPLVKNIQKPNDVHFTDEGYQLLGKEIADFIARQLKI